MITLVAIVALLVAPAALIAWVHADRFSTRTPHVLDPGRPDGADQTWSSALGWHA